MKWYKTVGIVAELLCLLYLFFFAIEGMGEGFKFFGRGFAEVLMSTTANPFIGLFVGILTTSIVQSSSLTTSILVGMVAAGAIPLRSAIPIVMGANIGTSVTNTLVSLGHIRRRIEFRRAFSGAILHDIFNVLTVIVLLPLELSTHYLQFLATTTEHIFEGLGGVQAISPLKAAVQPLVIGLMDLMKSTFPAAGPGIAMVGISLLVLFFALTMMVRILRGVMLSRVENVLDRFLLKWPILTIFFGTVVTAIVQSSSITTSVVVPLIAGGLFSLEAVYPFLLGANVGTTVTALMASLVTRQPSAIIVALTHFFFNVSGIVIFYPLRFIPIAISRGLGWLAFKNKIYPLMYILFVFFIIPLTLIFLFGGRR
jgi:sodium-dependent phosphate cotransporter